MSKKEFLNKYPHLNDEGNISSIKLWYLREWLALKIEDPVNENLELDLEKHLNYLKKLKREKNLNIILN